MNAGLLFSHTKVTGALMKTSGTEKCVRSQLSSEGKVCVLRGNLQDPTLNLLLIKTDVGLGAQT